ncbi:MAG: ATP-binding protein [Gemmatimonadota bacterium]
MGETRVDLLRLLEDLRDAYPGSLEETILTEIVANALDSSASEIRLLTNPAAGVLTVLDDGQGMSRQALSRYHDLAVTGKRRGRSIGFAGVGIKLALLLSDQVVTETRSPRAKRYLATSWRLASRTRAPWRWIEPPGLLAGAGTGVRLDLTNPLSPLVDRGFIEATLLRHFQPLFDSAFDEILAPFYPAGIRFHLNDDPLPRTAADPDRVLVKIRIGRQRKPSGEGFLTRDADLAEDELGIAVSTLGKVIKRGWDWLGLMAPRPVAVGGLEAGGVIEIPALAECLTLNKADFIRTGPRGATYLGYRKAVQEVVSAQLEAWGEGAERGDRRRPRTRGLERDLRSILADLSDEYPLLATLVERSRGGQRRLRLGDEPSPRGILPGVGVAAEPESGPVGPTEPDPAVAERDHLPDSGQEDGSAAVGPAADELPDPALPGRGGRKKPARYGLRVRFESRPEDPALGRLVDSTVWVNDAHPACRRAVASRSEGYHVALTAAMALASLAVTPVDAPRFVTEFLTRWGQAGRDGSGRAPDS